MEGLGDGGGGIEESSRHKDLLQFGVNPEGGGALFDASQYAFFGNDVVEEVELGGLEDEEETLPPVEFDDDNYQLDVEENEMFGSLAEVDGLASAFYELNRVRSTQNAGALIDRGSREGSSAADWVQEREFPNWPDPPTFDAESIQESKRWSLQRYPSAPDHVDFKPLHRTSSYPDQQQRQPQLQHPHQPYASEPVLIPKSSFPSFPPPGSIPQRASPASQSHYPNVPYPSSGRQTSLSSPNISPLSNPQLRGTALPHGLQFGGNLPQLAPPGLSVNNGMRNQWPNQNSVYPGDRPSLLNNMLQQMPPQGGLMPPNVMSEPQGHQFRSQRPFQQTFGHLSGLQSRQFDHPHSMSPPMMNNFDLLPLGDLRDQRAKTLLRAGHGLGYSLQDQKTGNGWPRFRSKYMSANEIENILRMQLAAMHSNDPYVDDYYHQACLAKKFAGGKIKHHFCPTNLKDGSRAHPNTEPHAFLQVDALGRVAFASIRRPRPLLEVEPPNSSVPSSTEQTVSEKPLEQEPMLAARVAIEDGLSLLLDVDDIDRFLEFNQFQDGGMELRHRRQVLLEGLATSLKLVDPLVDNSRMEDLARKDDLIFLRVVSLPKGRKLLLRYLQLLSPRDELIRIVCMAIFRHLRFLFGSTPADPAAAETTLKLADVVSSCVQGMELKGLAACLASVVCSAEHPSLRPVGSPAGDRASFVLKSVLERATDLLKDSHPEGNCSVPNRVFWQASFDAFFGLLTKYCFNKYDSIMQSIRMQSPSDVATVASDAARAISREIPVDLLRASLPHTNEQQRKVLLEFARRSVPVSSIDQGG